ncbi:unnamed protein product [Rotaria socialis]|uniref:Antifreeze protein n=1 Tax=Rotaria socialis TaxID=392032 RepID=A0A818LM24_9BILA|nr:unnamed protein product [Rotaria socialis]CAF3575191.1 unnamed protein product [Rotaria socialis]CAF3704902.1 unnamed protein product [Rotaria socialis]CAF4376758.1 unnamed protein product [Rotaria socialis]CAF4457271.1 unnamed protein product [Rotaria socialis]
MNTSTTHKVILWATIAWVILVSFPKRTAAGPLAFAACVAELAGPVCAAAASTATTACAATAFCPPLWYTCMGSLIAASCGSVCVTCAAAFFAPTL